MLGLNPSFTGSPSPLAMVEPQWRNCSSVHREKLISHHFPASQPRSVSFKFIGPGGLIPQHSLSIKYCNYANCSSYFPLWKKCLETNVWRIKSHFKISIKIRGIWGASLCHSHSSIYASVAQLSPKAAHLNSLLSADVYINTFKRKIKFQVSSFLPANQYELNRWKSSAQ